MGPYRKSEGSLIGIGIAVAGIVIGIILWASIMENRHRLTNKINACEESLPRNQKCIIKAIPEQLPVENSNDY